MKYFLWLLRIVVGVLFIFSGLVKANDPLGLSYKMNEFFEVWHMTGMLPYSLALSIAMIAFEIIAGVALLLGYAFRVFSFLLLLLITFFTFLTAYVLFSGKIKECGCFGDCIKISNTETFYKDVALLVMSIILFAFRKRIKPLLSGYPGTAVIILSVFFAFGIQWWALEHLPFHDCLPFKVGNNLWEKTQLPPGAKPAVYETRLVYQKDGVKKEFTMENYPWQDSTWVFVEQKTTMVKEATGDAAIKDFVLNDYDGNNHTEEILKAPGYQFLFFIRNVDNARKDNIDKLQHLMDEAEKLNIPSYILSSSDKTSTIAFQQKYGLIKYPVFSVDGTASKTGMRSDPGLMLLENGTVRGKWSFRDYPGTIKMNGTKLELK
jgi:uncharacterized membrane protein YphA (DoxX/SURF4 family)